MALDGIGSPFQPLFRLYKCDLWTGRERHHTVCSSGRVNQCGHVVVLGFLVTLSAHSRVILEQVHVKMLWLWRPPPHSSSFLEAFVIQSALFVQLENSTGLLQHPTYGDPEASWRTFSWILNCPVQPERAINFIWNQKLPWSLLLLTSSRFFNDWQTLKIRQNSFDGLFC